MTDSDTQTETWKPIPGYPFYEASEITGRVRSVPREAHGRTYRSVVKVLPRVEQRLRPGGRHQRGGAARRRGRFTRLVLLAFVGPCPPGQEARHLNGNSLDNRAENLAWGTKAENTEDQFAHGRPRAERPPKVCPRCNAEHHDPGRRCHACVTEIGEEAARLLAAGVPLDQVGQRLDYPSLAGVLVLAQKYGGLRLTLPRRQHPVSATAVTLRTRRDCYAA